MSFGDHLDEFRIHLIRGLIAVLVLAIVAFFFKDFLFDDIILKPREPEFFTNRLLCYLAHHWNLDLCINQTPFEMINIKLAGQFRSHIIISIIAGVVIGFPYLIWELWRFIKPALNQNELNNSRGILFAVSILFTVGVLFGYYLILPLSINFLSSYSISDQVLNQINFDSYFSIITSITLASGVVFELPVVIYFLSKIGLVTPHFLKKYRRHSVVAFVVLAAIITPPDVFSQILVAIPLLILYEFSIKISKRVVSKRRISTGIDD
ncbi:MAG: twin-arginine translocase subunit TatC [Bacteroidales bacterium]|nr:twin-arginine translocase subunit TatC [Bacteroidales bacterium]